MEVKVYSPQMGEKVVATDATTWGQLQGDLRKQGISFNKMKAVIGETRHTLEAEGASLPQQGFTLFLMNKKTKAGGKHYATYKYGQLRGTIRFILDQDPGTLASDYFNAEKNYTLKGTEVMRDLLENYKHSKPEWSDVEKFLADAKANKGKKKAAPKKEKAVAQKSLPKKKSKGNPDVDRKPEPKVEPKETKVSKNEVPEPKRGFGKDEVEPTPPPTPAPKKKNSIIEDAKKAVEEIEVEAEEVKPNVSDVVEDVKISKATEEVLEDTTELVGNALEVYKLKSLYKRMKDISLKGVDKGIHKQFKEAKQEVKEVLDSCVYIMKKEAEEIAKKAKAEEERLAKEAEEEAAKEAKRAEDARVAQEKADHDREMKSQFNDVFSDFSDVRR